jgi:rhodanese-related sulfurtransferase
VDTSVILDVMILSVSPQAAQALLVRGEVEVIDVREAHEWAAGYIPGARHVPLSELRAKPRETLTRDGLVFVCAAGVRSETAARIALANGVARVYNLTAGMRGWTKAGLPVAHPELAAAV